MKEKQVAAIVRRVTMDNGKLQLGALMPRIIADEDVSIIFFIGRLVSKCVKDHKNEARAVLKEIFLFQRLVFSELPFFEDVINYKFNRTKQDVTQEQTDVIRELIEKMDLLESGP